MSLFEEYLALSTDTDKPLRCRPRSAQFVYLACPSAGGGLWSVRTLDLSTNTITVAFADDDESAYGVTDPVDIAWDGGDAWYAFRFSDNAHGFVSTVTKGSGLQHHYVPAGLGEATHMDRRPADGSMWVVFFSAVLGRFLVNGTWSQWTYSASPTPLFVANAWADDGLCYLADYAAGGRVVSFNPTTLAWNEVLSAPDHLSYQFGFYDLTFGNGRLWALGHDESTFGTFGQERVIFSFLPNGSDVQEEYRFVPIANHSGPDRFEFSPFDGYFYATDNFGWVSRLSETAPSGEGISVHAFDGSAWVEIPVLRWTGTEWVQIPVELVGP